MAEQFNAWLNKFVDNGADPDDVVNWPENGGGSGESWVLKKQITTDTTFTINYQPILDLLNQNGYDTNLSISELQEQELDYVHYPLAISSGGSSYSTELTIEIGSACAVYIAGAGFNLSISFGDSTTPLKDIFANAPKTIDGDSDLNEVYLMPWFDITPVNND